MTEAKQMRGKLFTHNSILSLPRICCKSSVLFYSSDELLYESHEMAGKKKSDLSESSMILTY